MDALDKSGRWAALSVLLTLVLIGCGGSGGAAPPPPPPTAAEAATATANNNTMCQALLTSNAPSFYWEIGDAGGVLVSGSVTAPGGTAVKRTDVMPIASASKWLYAAYVVQKRGGPAGLSGTTDVPFLNFTSGYSQFSGTNAGLQRGICLHTQTVQECLDGNNAALDPTTQGIFYYDSGHMEVHAATYMGLAGDTVGPLADEVLGTLIGKDNVGVNSAIYTQPLLAGGVAMSAAAYAAVLQGILSGSLTMHDVLANDGQYTVPTYGNANGYSPLTGALNADGVQERWGYSLGHWVEDDPTYGDGTFSSAGAFGFYPWIDKTLTYYGIVARQAPANAGDYEGFQSAECGRLIRQAFMTGTEVTASVPTP